jgi:hypothetical protein
MTYWPLGLFKSEAIFAGTSPAQRLPMPSVQLVENSLADLLRHQRGGAVAVDAVSDIQIGLIQRQRLNQRRVTGEDFPDMNGASL